jgi:hypothetical protein
MPRDRVNDIFTEYSPPWVEEVPGEPFRYRVESQSEPLKWHLVDLTERGGHGMCDCKHFQTVAGPNFRRHGKWIPYAPKRNGVSECKHLRAAWDHYHLYVAIPMMKSFKAGIPKPNTPQ